MDDQSLTQIFSTLKPIVLILISLAFPFLSIVMIPEHHFEVQWLGRLVAIFGPYIYVAIIISPGLIPILWLRWSARWKTVYSLIYLAFMPGPVILFALSYACSAHGNCV